MVDRITLRSPMADVEDRLGVRPIAEMLALRQEATEDLALLRARHGSFGTFDHERKTLLATLRMKARAIATRDKLKVTEAYLDDSAHSAPEYYDLITTATQERSQLTLLEAKVEAVDAEIQRANAITRYLTSEARL